MARFTDRGTLVLVRHFPGPISRVWAYLTDPKLLAKWLSDGVVGSCAGGEVRFDMGAHGHITAYEPPHLLEYTWNEEEASCGPVADALVRWDLAEDGDRVRLTLTHSRLPEAELIAHGAGWHAFLERLLDAIEGREPRSIEEAYARYKEEYARQ
jgi:uncharacterized protein YndB with AHSA1/START domain